MVRTRSLTAAAPPATLRSGLAAATTRLPSATSGSITRSQRADSANAPWTRTIVHDIGTVPFSTGAPDRAFAPIGRAPARVGRRPDS